MKWDEIVAQKVFNINESGLIKSGPGHTEKNREGDEIPVIFNPDPFQ